MCTVKHLHHRGAMNIPHLPSSSRITSTPSIQQTRPTEGASRWLDQYRSDQRTFENVLKNSNRIQSMDSADILRLQALTQRFSIQTDLASRLADRFQNTAKQLLQQGG